MSSAILDEAAQAEANKMHDDACERHRIAVDRYLAEPTAENREATWAAFDETWRLFCIRVGRPDLQ